VIKKFLQEFREFAERGNAIDMAVGVIAGAAMNGVVNSLVKDIIMPPIGLMLGDMDMSAISIALSGGAKIGIGLFMNSLAGFILTMFAVFVFVRMVNKLRTQKAALTRECPYCRLNVPARAIKCPNCLSKLTPVKFKSQQGGGLDKLIKEINPLEGLKSVRNKIKKIVK
jgi:large conductance mechanosensitive channel